mgnify:CR=1 FL=1
MIEIKILDAHKEDANILRETARYLLALAGDKLMTEDEKLEAMDKFNQTQHNYAIGVIECDHPAFETMGLHDLRARCMVCKKPAKDCENVLPPELAGRPVQLEEIELITNIHTPRTDDTKCDHPSAKVGTSLNGHAPAELFCAVCGIPWASCGKTTTIPKPPEMPPEKLSHIEEVFKTPGHIVSVPDEEHLDAAGMPWDSEIHSRTKSQTENGLWKLKRGKPVSSGIPLFPPVAPPVPIPPVPMTTGIDLADEGRDKSVTTGHFSPPLAEPELIRPIPILVKEALAHIDVNLDSEPDYTLWFEAMAKFTQVIQDKQLTHAQMTTILNSAGVESIPLLQQRQDLIPIVLQKVDHFIATGEL